MKEGNMRVRQLLLGACLASCLAIACGDDEDSRPAGMSGSAGKAGNSGKAGSGGSTATAGTTGLGGDESMGGTMPEPGMAGMPGEPMLGGAGGMGPAELGFADFVHDLIENETADDNPPSSVSDKQFSDPTDDHGHYLVPASVFNDLF
jgi:hypothetical protein